MNQYRLQVGNAVIKCEGTNEYGAMVDLAIFNVGDLIGYYSNGCKALGGCP